MCLMLGTVGYCWLQNNVRRPELSLCFLPVRLVLALAIRGMADLAEGLGVMVPRMDDVLSFIAERGMYQDIHLYDCAPCPSPVFFLVLYKNGFPGPPPREFQQCFGGSFF